MNDNDLDLGPIEASLGAATPGPWVIHDTMHSAEKWVSEEGRGVFGLIAKPNTGREDYGKANMEFIAAAPDHVLALLVEVCKLRVERDQLREGAAGLTGLSNHTPAGELSDQRRHELVDAAVDAIEPNVANRTAAHNTWNNLATDPDFVRAIIELRSSTALAAARIEGAEAMREKAAVAVETHWAPDTDEGFEIAEGSATLIRALPTTPDAPNV